MRFLPVLTLALLLPFALMAQTATKGAAPSWVEMLPVPTAEAAVEADLRAAVRGGIFFHLVDTQTAWDEVGRHTYLRLVREVTDRAGLEGAAAIQHTFDPARENYVLNHIFILRDGEKIDLIDQVEWDVFRRESRLDAGIIDGSLTAMIQVPGLRVGDIIDYGLMLTRTPFYPGDQRSVRVSVEFDLPVILTRHVANWPSDWPMVEAETPERVLHSSEVQGPVTRHIWRRVEHMPLQVETDTPNEALGYAEVQYADTASWDGLVAAFVPHYLKDYPLPPEWEARVEAIAAAEADPRARTLAALRLVQDEIRYVSISVGDGGYLARPPATVIAEGFGDCKDKSLLLATLLARLGIDAEVALTDLDEGYGLAARLPHLGAFDHMIVRARIAGQSYWLDPTSSHQGGELSANVGPDLGFALPIIRGSSDGMEPIERKSTMAWVSRTEESYQFAEDGITLSVTTRFRGAAADYWRYDIATRSLRQIDDGFLDYYRNRHPGLDRAEPLGVADDREANVITVEERYRLPKVDELEDRLREDFGFAAEDFARSIREAAPGPRRTPLWIGRERQHTHVVYVSDAPLEFEAPEQLSISNPGFDFVFEGSASDGGNMVLEWRFRTKTRVIPTEDVAGVVRDARQVQDNYYYSWSLTPTGGKPKY